MSTKRIYLLIEASNQKNKTTLFYSTLKVRESKVVLFFSYLAFWPRYGGFLVHFLNILLKTSSGGGRGSRSTFFIKIEQKSLSYTYENIFRPLVLNFEKNVD